MLRIYSFCCSKIGMGVVRRASPPNPGEGFYLESFLEEWTLFLHNINLSSLYLTRVGCEYYEKKKKKTRIISIFFPKIVKVDRQISESIFLKDFFLSRELNVIKIDNDKWIVYWILYFVPYAVNSFAYCVPRKCRIVCACSICEKNLNTISTRKDRQKDLSACPSPAPILSFLLSRWNAHIFI